MYVFLCMCFVVKGVVDVFVLYGGSVKLDNVEELFV